MTALSFSAAVRTDVGPVRRQQRGHGLREPAARRGRRRRRRRRRGRGRQPGGDRRAGPPRQVPRRRPARPRAGAPPSRTGNAAIGFIAGCRPQMAGMSTTLTAVALDDDGYLVANVGDSRTYLLRDGALKRLTRDDSLVQRLVDSGAVTPAEARTHPQRSLVLEALDGDPERRPPAVTPSPPAPATGCSSARTGCPTPSTTSGSRTSSASPRAEVRGAPRRRRARRGRARQRLGRRRRRRAAARPGRRLALTAPTAGRPRPTRQSSSMPRSRPSGKSCLTSLFLRTNRFAGRSLLLSRRTMKR